MLTGLLRHGDANGGQRERERRPRRSHQWRRRRETETGAAGGEVGAAMGFWMTATTTFQ
jgi:hypothetical protein